MALWERASIACSIADSPSDHDSEMVVNVTYNASNAKHRIDICPSASQKVVLVGIVVPEAGPSFTGCRTTV